MHHTPKSLIAVLLMVLMFMPLGFTSITAPGNDPFRIERKPPKLGYLTTRPDPVAQDLIKVPMLAKIAGVIATIEPRSYSKLRRAISHAPIDPSTLSNDTLIAYLHLHRDDLHRAFEVHDLSSASDPDAMALRSVEDPNAIWGISGRAFKNLAIRWPSNTQSVSPSDSSTPIRFVLPKPYTQSTTVLDRRTIRARIGQNYPMLTRILKNETFRVRLPKGYNPGFPAGVLVWISPMPDGRIPKIFEPILDKLGLIAIGVDNNGNQREITDRLQNHLDSIESLASHYHIDRDRVYLTGMSGGGRSSGILQLAFPDLFAGAVPIVGLDTYHNAPTGDPGKYWPARLAKPAGRWMELLKTRRIAAITGTADFNQPEMSVRQELLKRDGIDMRLDIIEGMAHTMPTSEQFASALNWVDEPRRAAMLASYREAQSLMEDYTQQFGESTPPATPAARRQLIKIITIAPWTDPAWAAAALLGYERGD